MDDVPKVLRDTGYVLVGFGVMWFQRAQVLRRELGHDLPDLGQPLAAAAREAVEMVRSALAATPPTRSEG